MNPDEFIIVVLALAIAAVVFVHVLHNASDAEEVTVYVDVTYAGGDHEVRRAPVPWSWFVAFVDKHAPERHPLRAFLARAHTPGRVWTIKNSSSCMLLESASPTPATYWATGDAGRALYAKCITEIEAREDAARSRRKGTLWAACADWWTGCRARVARVEKPRAAY